MTSNNNIFVNRDKNGNVVVYKNGEDVFYANGSNSYMDTRFNSLMMTQPLTPNEHSTISEAIKNHLKRINNEG